MFMTDTVWGEEALLTEQDRQKKKLTWHYGSIIVLFLVIFGVVLTPLELSVKLALLLGLFALQLVIAYLHSRSGERG